MKIVIGGQMGKNEIKQIVLETAGADTQVEIKDDISAAMDIKSGNADLYLGACMTGGGGALAMAIAILGYGNCQALSSDDENVIKEAIRKGVKAFGFTPTLAKSVIPLILSNL
jgi:hypothetical protein